MVTATLPLVHILPVRDLPGATTLADDVPQLEALPFAEAFAKQYPTDAHFVTYCLSDGSDMPRLNKPILPRIEQTGRQVLVTMLVFDYDNPGHAPWQPGQIDQFLAKLDTAAKSFPLAMGWTLLYTTRNGVRLVYVLSDPVSPAKGEGHHRWMVEQFNKAGVAVDRKTPDWTHLFRLPYVLRDGTPTWSDNALLREFIPLGEITDPTLLGESLDPHAGRVADATAGEAYDCQKPTPDEARALREVFSTETGRVNQSAFIKTAKHRLKGRECYGCIFRNEPLAAPGSRDATIHQFVGQAIGLLYYVDGTTPESIYSLFLPAVEQMEPDNDTPDWTNLLWDHICRLWGKEAAKHQEQQQKEIVKATEAVGMLDRIIEGMRQWCRHPDLFHADKAIRNAYAERHLIASVDNRLYVLKPDGTYDWTPIGTQQLIAAIRTRGMDSIVPTSVANENGTRSDKTPQMLMNDHSTVVKEVEAIPGKLGGEVQGIDTPQARLIVPCFARNPDLMPEYSPLVDEWMHVLWGTSYDLCCAWIGYALAYDEGPICALSIMGSPGVGKKLFVHGLAETLIVPALALGKDLVGSYQYGLLESPFLSVDEGWPRSSGGRHPADEFRSLVSGDLTVVDRKFLAPTKLKNPVRIIFTANNHTLIQMLTHGRELSPEDRDAIAIRLLHVNVGAKAAIWLAKQGGVALTGKAGARWIAGDAGQASDFVLARHFLWLWSKRHDLKKPGGRLLVEGNADPQVLFDMRTGAGSGPMVIETLLKMLEAKTVFPSVAVVDGRVFALSSGVLEYYRSNMPMGGGKLSAEAIGNVFRGLSVPGLPENFVLKSREDQGRRRWIEIDIQTLLWVAEKDGWPCRKLRELVEQQRGIGGRTETNVISS